MPSPQLPGLNEEDPTKLYAAEVTVRVLYSDAGNDEEARNFARSLGEHAVDGILGSQPGLHIVGQRVRLVELAEKREIEVGYE